MCTCPRRDAHFLARIIFVGAHIVLVCGTEQDWSLLVAGKCEPRVHGLLQLHGYNQLRPMRLLRKNLPDQQPVAGQGHLRARELERIRCRHQCDNWCLRPRQHFSDMIAGKFMLDVMIQKRAHSWVAIVLPFRKCKPSTMVR